MTSEEFDNYIKNQWAVDYSCYYETDNSYMQVTFSWEPMTQEALDFIENYPSKTISALGGSGILFYFIYHRTRDPRVPGFLREFQDRPDSYFLGSDKHGDPFYKQGFALMTGGRKPWGDDFEVNYYMFISINELSSSGTRTFDVDAFSLAYPSEVYRFRKRACNHYKPDIYTNSPYHNTFKFYFSFVGCVADKLGRGLKYPFLLKTSVIVEDV